MLACVGALLMGVSSPVFAYGLDGLFGGRPNPDGSLIVPVPDPNAGQSPERVQTVLDHPRPDYDPQPLKFGDFLVKPSAEAGIAYNSNIYATPKAASDSVIDLAPAVSAISNWGRHFLGILVSGDFDFYQHHSDLNTNDAVVQVNGRYDLIDHMAVGGNAGYQSAYVPRSSLDNANGNQPVLFNLYTAGASATRDAGIIAAQFNYDFSRYAYAQAPNPGGSESVYDNNANNFGGKLTYNVSDNFKPYANLQFNSRIYDTTASRNSHGYRADLGAAWDWGGITSLDLYGGWLSQDYSAFGGQPVNQGGDFGGKLTWNVTGLTTLVLDADRSVQEALIPGYNSFLASGGSAALTHELRRNILLEGDLSYTVDAYQGLSQRQDDITGAGVGTRYLINRNLYADLDYNWSHRSSSVEGQGYADHMIFAKLGLQF